MKYHKLLHHWAFHHSKSNTIRMSLALAILICFGISTTEHWVMWIFTAIWFMSWAAWCSRLNPAWRHTYIGVRFGWKATNKVAILQFSEAGYIYVKREFKDTYWISAHGGNLTESETLVNARSMTEACMKAYEFYKDVTDNWNYED
jgi:hypothetical protein